MVINLCVFLDIAVLKPDYVGASPLIKKFRGGGVKCNFAILGSLGGKHGKGILVVGVVEEEGEEEEEEEEAVEGGGMDDCEGGQMPGFKMVQKQWDFHRRFMTFIVLNSLIFKLVALWLT